MAANCPALPDVAWWSKSHEKLAIYVHKKYDDDWNAYIWKWLSYRKKVVRLYKLKKPLVMKSRGIELSGEQLAEYATKIDARIAVVKCLSNSVKKSDVKAAAAKTIKYNCRPVPKVAWWGDLNHEGLISLVRARYKNNWPSFIKFWDGEMQALLTSFNLGQEAVVNKAGLALSSEELALYYTKVLELVAVLHCLADDAQRGKSGR